MLYLVCLILRFFMLLTIAILLISLFRNIELISPENRKIKINELIQKYDEDLPQDEESASDILLVGHRRNNSLNRFDQFYKHYMKHLLDEI